MSGQIDVLDAMRKALDVINDDITDADEVADVYEKLREARAAVAELIEADKELDAAVIAYDAAHSFSLGDIEYVSAEDQAVIRLDAAKARRAAALARCGGA